MALLEFPHRFCGQIMNYLKPEEMNINVRAQLEKPTILK